MILNPQVRVDARHIPLQTAAQAALDRPLDRFGSLQEVREAAEREYILRSSKRPTATSRARPNCWGWSAATSTAR